MLCQCKNEARRLQVKKEGHNKGRWFYACADRKCQFFEFEGRSPEADRPYYAPQSPQNAPQSTEQHQEVMSALRQIYAEIKQAQPTNKLDEALDEIDLKDLPFNE